MTNSIKRMGRPPGSSIPPELQRKPRSVRLDAARWAKLQSLGVAWLENAIDNADVRLAGVPQPSSSSTNT